MEDGKLTWKDTQGLDRVRRAHAQKNITSSSTNGTNSKSQKNFKELGFIFFVNFSKLALAAMQKTISVRVGSIDMYVHIVKVSMQQKTVKNQKKSQKTSRALQ